MSDLRSRGPGAASGRPPTALSSSTSVPWSVASGSADGGSRPTTLQVMSGGPEGDDLVLGASPRDLPRTESDADKQRAKMHVQSLRPRTRVEIAVHATCTLAALFVMIHFVLGARDLMTAAMPGRHTAGGGGGVEAVRRGSFRAQQPEKWRVVDIQEDVGTVAPNRSSPDPEALGRAAAHQKAVSDAFVHAWDGYKRYAWGKDSLHPISKKGSDDFLGMAITVVDSMDTALVMGLGDVFEDQYAWVARELRFGYQEDINVFETTIRVVGGLLSAYALSGRATLLELADDLGHRLLPAFESKTGIPYGTLGLKSGKKYNPSWVKGASSVAEAGTLQLEFRYLAKLTGKSEYREKVDRTARFFERKMYESSSATALDGLFPMFIHPETGRVMGTPTITFGARGDSLYEYFLKSYLQTNCTEQWLLQMYETSMAGMTSHLIYETGGPHRFTYVAEINKNAPTKPIMKMDHLVCFVPGMLALGAVRGAGKDVAGDRAKNHLAIAERLMRTCYSMYSTTATGLAPEIAHMDQPNSPELKPKDGAKHSLLRPETVESLFILWRVTKKQEYRDWGWEIFLAIEKHARIASGGYSGIKDVTQVPPQHNDKMDSFFVAETLKYLYLLFSPDEVVPLDKYVFTTEAHPLPIFDWKDLP